jgi:hypothetical protein
LIVDANRAERGFVVEKYKESVSTLEMVIIAMVVVSLLASIAVVLQAGQTVVDFWLRAILRNFVG